MVTVTDLASLTAAIATSNHSTITIAPGTYALTETISITRSIVLRAAVGAQAILDGGQQRLVLSMSGLIDVRLEGLTIINGRSANGGPGQDGGCVKLEGGANVTVADSLIHSCTAARDGGGILVAPGTALVASRLHLERSVVRDSVAERSGGGIAARQAMRNQCPSQTCFVAVSIVDSLLSGNVVTTLNGGAIFFSSGGAGLSVARAVFERNRAGNKGGAIAALGASQPKARLHSILFDSNSAGESGLALHLDGTVPDPLVNLTFRNHVDPPAQAVAMITIPRALLWQCPLGKWMPPSGLIPAADFEHCFYDCRAGFFGNSSFETTPECTAACPAAHFCPAGSVAPTVCPAGTYLRTQGASDESNCIVCSPGQFSAGNASLACTSCPAGTLSEVAGASACALCPAGGFCAADGAASARQVLQSCPAGSFNPTRGATNSSACILCPAGTTSPISGSGDESNCAQCEVGKFNPLPGQPVAAACVRCPDFSTTRHTGALAVDECECDEGFVRTVRPDGVAQCECAAGRQIENGVSCVPCPRQTWKDWTGNDQCRTCPVDRTTTLTRGATSPSDCVCDAGTYARAGTTSADDALACDVCTPSMTNCTRPNATLEAMPLMPGHWRQNPHARLVRVCDVPSACLGREAAGDASCAPGHFGPLCDSCAGGYFGGRGRACKPCADAGDIGVTLALIAGACVGLVALVCCVRRYFRQSAVRWTKDLATGKVNLHSTKGQTKFINAKAAEVATLAKQESAESAQQESATAKLRAGCFRAVAGIAVKARILISLYQVLSRTDAAYGMRYPPAFTNMLRIFGSVNLPIHALPLHCLHSFGSGFLVDLVIKTATPLVVVLALMLTGRLLRRTLPTVAGACSDLWFFVVFLIYPSTSATIFEFFMMEAYEGAGEVPTYVMRADRSVEVGSPAHATFTVYALVMLVVYPIGVPCLYASLLYRSRRELREIRRVELVRGLSKHLETMHADAAESAGESDEAKEIRREADAADKQQAKAYQLLRDSLPTELKRLTAGYELRCYWFEIFECLRKIALVGLPVFFRPPGSVTQRIFGLLVCFLTWGMYCAFSPFLDYWDGMRLSFEPPQYPDNEVLAYVLPVLLILPIALAFIFEARLSNELGRLKREAAAAKAREAAREAKEAKEAAARSPMRGLMRAKTVTQLAVASTETVKHVALTSTKTVKDLASVNTITALEQGLVTSADTIVGAKRDDSALVQQAREAVRSARRDASGAAARDAEPPAAATTTIAEDAATADAVAAASATARRDPSSDVDISDVDISVEPVLQQEDAFEARRRTR